MNCLIPGWRPKSGREPGAPVRCDSEERSHSRISRHSGSLFLHRVVLHVVFAHRVLLSNRRLLRLLVSRLLRVGLGHVLAMLGLAVPGVSFFVVDLGIGVDPYLATTTAGRLRNC